MKKNLNLAFLLIILILSCKKETIIEPIISENTNNYALILNEGNYNWGNATISLLNLDSFTITNQVFEYQNQRKIGDVLQSAFLHQNNWYLVLNNSNKIEVIHNESFKSVGVIEGFNSPRYFLPVSTSKAYVTDLYTNEISIVDLISNSIIGSIKTNSPTEELQLLGENVYITAPNSKFIYIIDPNKDLISDSIPLRKGVNSLTLDNNNNLWILSKGFVSEQILPCLYRLNSVSKKIEDSLELTNYLDGFNNRIRFSSFHNTIFLLSNGLYKIKINQLKEGLTSKLIPSKGNSFYGFGVSLKGDIYLSDAKGFVENGIVFKYDLEGILKDSFQVNRIPSEIYFYEK